MSKSTETKGQKRKGASEPAVATKKVKTTPTKAEPAQLKSALKKKNPSHTIVKAIPDAAASKPAKSTKPTRKRAEDLIEEHVEAPVTETVTEVAPGKVKKTRSAKAKDEEEGGVAVPPAEEKTTGKGKGKSTGKSAKTVKQQTIVKESAPTAENEDAEESDEDDVDDQTAALLAGFESSEDENDPQDERGVALDKLPSLPDEKQVRKQLKAAEADDENTPGVIYVGRIPHGFYEHQMRAYFSQFGDMTHLRLSRNKLTGRSKHYAFIEFASAAVADIVAKTMDKYLMFGHILQVRRIPADQVHANLWKGEGKRFKTMPRNKIEGGILRRGKTRENWEKSVEKENKRRQKKAEKLAELSYEFEMPEVRKVEDVPMKDADAEKDGVAVIPDADGAKPIADEEEEVAEPEKITAPKELEQPKQGRKGKKGAQVAQEKMEAPAAEAQVPLKRTKATKEGGKTKKAKKQ